MRVAMWNDRFSQRCTPPRILRQPQIAKDLENIKGLLAISDTRQMSPNVPVRNESLISAKNTLPHINELNVPMASVITMDGRAAQASRPNPNAKIVERRPKSFRQVPISYRHARRRKYVEHKQRDVEEQRRHQKVNLDARGRSLSNMLSSYSGSKVTIDV